MLAPLLIFAAFVLGALYGVGLLSPWAILIALALLLVAVIVDRRRLMRPEKRPSEIESQRGDF